MPAVDRRSRSVPPSHAKHPICIWQSLRTFKQKQIIKQTSTQAHTHVHVYASYFSHYIMSLCCSIVALFPHPLSLPFLSLIFSPSLSIVSLMGGDLGGVEVRSPKI